MKEERREKRKNVQGFTHLANCLHKDLHLQYLYELILSDKCGETVNSLKRKTEHF